MSIGEALPARSFDRLRGALGVVYTEGDPLVVAEIELAEIPLNTDLIRE